MTADLEWAFFECLKVAQNPSGYWLATQHFEKITGTELPEDWSTFLMARLNTAAAKHKERTRLPFANSFDRRVFQFQAERLNRMAGGNCPIADDKSITLRSSDAMSFLSAGRYIDLVSSVVKASEFDTIYISGFKLYDPTKVHRVYGMFKDGHFGVIQKWEHNLVRSN